MKTLRDKTEINGMEMKNRFVRAAIGDVTDRGHLSESNIELYRKLSAGGAAAIITGFTVVDEAETTANHFSLATDEMVEEYRPVAQAIHDGGSKGIVQLVYLGGYAPQERPLAPSVFKNPYTQVESVEMSIDDISEMKQKFADAALRAKAAGFDGVEIHGAHGFLHNQFFSPLFNHRTDAYGGSIENRSRFIIETYEEIRKAVGRNFQIWIKMAVNEGDEHGVSTEDYLYLAKELDRRGIDAIETSGVWMAFKAKDRMFFAEQNRLIATVINAPLIQTGGNRDFADLEEALNTIGFDYVGLARPFISEPDLANKYLNGEIQKMRCLSCNGCCRNADFTCILDKKKE